MSHATPSREVEMQVQNLCKGYGFGSRHNQVIEDCSFCLNKQEITVLIGPSGCGKSTLINLLAGFERPDSGSITMSSGPVTGPGGDRLVVFQETALFPWMTTYSNVAYGLRVQRRKSTQEINSLVGAMIDKVGLGDFRAKYPTQLSGGMQRRGELARMLVNDPILMILDEPFRGLDAMTRELMQEYFVALLEERKSTVLFITSEIDEAIFMADRLLIMSNSPGKIVKEIPISLPRPRHKDMLKTEAYLTAKNAALNVLHQEALRAFASGSKAVQDFLEAYKHEQEIERKKVGVDEYTEPPTKP